MIEVDARCDDAPMGGWTCRVVIRDGDRAVSTHDVRVTVADLARLDPGAVEPSALVERSFAFLLEREPPTSILRAFDLSVIGRYFPDYEPEIRRRSGDRAT
jgi:hypothetical protein